MTSPSHTSSTSATSSNVSVFPSALIAVTRLKTGSANAFELYDITEFITRPTLPAKLRPATVAVLVLPPVAVTDN